MTKLYLITYESAHWCGADDMKVVVRADNVFEAEDAATPHMQDTMMELFAEEYEDGEYSDESPFYVTCVEVFTPEHAEWQYYKDPTQAQFYPEV